jgi:hypothetical protein
MWKRLEWVTFRLRSSARHSQEAASPRLAEPLFRVGTRLAFVPGRRQRLTVPSRLELGPRELRNDHRYHALCDALGHHYWYTLCEPTPEYSDIMVDLDRCERR